MNKAKRSAVIAGNWKMNMTPAETTDFMKALAPKVADVKEAKVVLCVPFVDIAAAVEATKGTNIEIGAENVHMEERVLIQAKSPARCLLPAVSDMLS